MNKKFKQTKIGRIPTDWEVLEVVDIGKVITGTTPSTGVNEYWGEGYPFVTPSDFSESKYVHETERYVTEEGIEKGKLIPKDSVMVTCIASVGEVAMASKQCITNQQVNTIICNEKVDSHFIYYTMLYNKPVLKRWAGITTSPIIKKSLFEQFPLTLPQFSKQQKIAEILGSVDEAIQKVDETIEKIERLKKGLMQELLTKGIGHTEFKDTEIGRIPKDWELVKLGDERYFRINKESIDPTHDIQNDKFLYIDIESIEGDTGVIKRIKEIMRRDTPSRARRVIHHNDVIMSTVRPYLKAFALVPEEYDNQICSTGFAVLSCKEEILPHYLLYMLFSNTVIEQCNRMMVGGQYPALNKSQVTRIKIPLSPLSEQKEIAEILFSFDKKLETLHYQKEKYKKIKKGLMNDLLTGRRRVKV